MSQGRKVAWVAGEESDVVLAGEGLELLDRGNSIRVGRDEQGLAALASQVERQLGRECRLSRAFESQEHDHGGWLSRAGQRGLSAAQHGSQLFIDDLDDLLWSGERLQHFRAGRPLSDPTYEVADHP